MATKTTTQTSRKATDSSAAMLRGRMGLSRKTFSRLLGVSERTLADWEKGTKVGESGLRRLREMERFRARLAEVVSVESVPEWVGTPNPAFDNLKPLEVIERGEIDRLWSMIFYLESGVPT